MVISKRHVPRTLFFNLVVSNYLLGRERETRICCFYPHMIFFHIFSALFFRQIYILEFREPMRWAPWHPPSVHLTKVLEAVAKEQKSTRFAKAPCWTLWKQNVGSDMPIKVEVEHGRTVASDQIWNESNSSLSYCKPLRLEKEHERATFAVFLLYVVLTYRCRLKSDLAHFPWLNDF